MPSLVRHLDICDSPQLSFFFRKIEITQKRLVLEAIFIGHNRLRFASAIQINKKNR